MLCREGKISLIGFLIGSFIGWLSFSGQFVIDYVTNESYLLPKDHILAMVVIFFSASFVIVRIIFRKNDFSIAMRSNFLGFVFVNSCSIFMYASEKHKAFGIYGMFMAFFHYSEYLTLAISNPSSLSLSSFMLFHSVQYVAAAVVSWMEFFGEAHYYPEMKKMKLFWIIGTVMCLAGECIRKLAMLTAKKSFHHIVQFERSQEHKLITDGIYSLMRHPSYVGWFYWSIGTQVILVNPICFILYIIASWLFFNERIYTEEITLLNFFGNEYLNYQKAVKTGLPFIKGYKIDIEPTKDPTS